MAEELLATIAKENFGRTKYIPVLHGRTESIQPTALILKQNRPWWKKPFHHTELKVLSKLEKYLKPDPMQLKGFSELAESSLTRINKKIQKKEIVEVKEKHEIILKAAEGAQFHYTSDTNLGDLELGMMDEEYYEDTDMRSLLAYPTLCKSKMEPYLRHKLYIVTGVVYSSMFRIVGKRESKLDLDGKIDFKTRFGGWLGRVGNIGGKCSSLNVRAALVSRKKKAPIFFTVCPVKYDESTGKLRIADNHFVGGVVARGITHVKLNRHRTDSIEDIFDVLEDHTDGNERNEIDELFEIPELEEKLETIKNLLLSSTKSRSELESLFVKFSYMLESILSGRGANRLYLDQSDYNVCHFEEGFLAEIGLKQDDDSSVTVSENLLQDIQDYGLIFKFLAGRSPEELDELETILMDERDENEHQQFAFLC